MRRRDLITLLGGAAAWPLAARAQQSGRMRRVGVLEGVTEDNVQAFGSECCVVTGDGGWEARRAAKFIVQIEGG